MKPKIFVGSSSDGLDVANAIQVHLSSKCDITIWTQGVFEIGGGTLDALIKCISSSDFAILVLTPDDSITSDGETKRAPRDNVILELGLCIGTIGRDRSFIVHERSANLKLPTDLAGVARAIFQMHSDDEILSSIGEATTRIDSAIKKIGIRSKSIELSELNNKDFALCMPMGHSKMDEFNRELKYFLMEKLVEEGIRMLDVCPAIDPASVGHTLWNFREKIHDLAERHSPKYLLAIWPGILTDSEQDTVIADLKRLARKGCRIAFINEFPQINRLDPDFAGKVFFIRMDVHRAIVLLCRYIKTQIHHQSHVLLIHASQEFNVAKERKTLYEKVLLEHDLTFESREIPSWSAEHTRDIVYSEFNALKAVNDLHRYHVIAAANDEMAIAAANALKDFCAEFSVSIPTKVVGYDGVQSARSLIGASESPLVATVAASARSYAITSFRALCKPGDDVSRDDVVIRIDRGDLITV